MSKHTPGPWTAEPLGNRWADGTQPFGVFFPDTEDGAPCGSRIEIADDLTEANARLIAAAPELLLAARNVVARLIELRRAYESQHGATHTQDFHEAESCLKDAIAKAEVRS